MKNKLEFLKELTENKKLAEEFGEYINSLKIRTNIDSVKAVVRFAKEKGYAIQEEECSFPSLRTMTLDS